jgi:hypothetical protein
MSLPGIRQPKGEELPVFRGWLPVDARAAAPLGNAGALFRFARVRSAFLAAAISNCPSVAFKRHFNAESSPDCPPAGVLEFTGVRGLFFPLRANSSGVRFPPPMFDDCARMCKRTELVLVEALIAKATV